MRLRIYLFLLTLVPAACVIAQDGDQVILNEMDSFEYNVTKIYREYQWLYYEEKQSAHELLAFEDVLGVYVKRLNEAYETMSLLGGEGIDQAQDITARALILRALTYLEKAPLDVTYFERACYDYYDALQLYENSENIPVIFKPLPEPLRIGMKTYTRLIDLLDEKGEDLFAFGQVHLSLRNFKVTSKLDVDAIELVRYSSQAKDTTYYTYKLAQQKLRDGFRTALQTSRPTDIYLGLPAGTYFIRSQKEQRMDYVNLATIYVRPNQFIAYVVEPIADWLIFYETPENLVKVNRDETQATAEADSAATTPRPRAVSTGGIPTTEHIAGIIEAKMQAMSVDDLDLLPISRTRKEFVQGMAKIVATRIQGEYLTSWNRWTLAWNISKSVTEFFAARRAVSMPTIILTSEVLDELM